VDQALWTKRLEAELDNVRAASDLAMAGGIDPIIAVKLAVALNNFWILRGYAAEGRHRIQAILDLPAVKASEQARAWALFVGATLADSQGDHAEARSMLESCLELRRHAGNPVEIAATLSTLALARLQGGDPDGAAESEREALAIFHDVGDKRGEAIGLLHLGQIDLWRGDGRSAQRDLERAREVARQIGHQEVEAESELSIGQVLVMHGDNEWARQHLERSLEIGLAAGDRRGEASATWWLGRLALEAGDSASARKLLDRALRAFQAQEMRTQLLGCLEDQALLAAAEGRPDGALEVAAAVEQARRRMVLGRNPWEEQRWRQRLGRLREALPEKEVQVAWDRGRRWEVEAAIKAALGGGGSAVKAQVRAT